MPATRIAEPIRTGVICRIRSSISATSQAASLAQPQSLMILPSFALSCRTKSRAAPRCRCTAESAPPSRAELTAGGVSQWVGSLDDGRFAKPADAGAATQHDTSADLYRWLESIRRCRFDRERTLRGRWSESPATTLSHLAERSMQLLSDTSLGPIFPFRSPMGPSI